MQKPGPTHVPAQPIVYTGCPSIRPASGVGLLIQLSQTTSGKRAGIVKLQKEATRGRHGMNVTLYPFGCFTTTVILEFVPWLLFEPLHAFTWLPPEAAPPPKEEHYSKRP